jgi:hypothetical protein
MLTVEYLNSIKPHTVFSKGTIENSPIGVWMTVENAGKELMWVAKTGAIGDWSIYIHWADRGYDYVVSNGDKVSSEANIKRLMPCTDEVFARYRV